MPAHLFLRLRCSHFARKSLIILRTAQISLHVIFLFLELLSNIFKAINLFWTKGGGGLRKIMFQLTTMKIKLLKALILFLSWFLSNSEITISAVLTITLEVINSSFTPLPPCISCYFFTTPYKYNFFKSICYESFIACIENIKRHTQKKNFRYVIMLTITYRWSRKPSTKIKSIVIQF